MINNPLGAEHASPGSTKDTKHSFRRATGADVLAVIGTIAALFTTFVLVEPWILVFPPWVKPLLGILLVGICIAFIMSPYEPLDRYFDIVPLVRHLLVTAGVILFILLLTWTPPTSQLMAQQVLAKQGMFLQRLYYKTALEIGNVTGITLFHQAGFKKSLAFELLGERAETVRDRRSVDVFLNNDPAVFYSLLSLFSPDINSTDTRSPQQPDLGLDTRIRYRDGDAGADIAPRLASAFPVSATTEETVNQLLNSEGATLLGHAVLGRTATGVREAHEPHEGEGTLRFVGDSATRNAILRVMLDGVVFNEQVNSRLAGLTTRAGDDSGYEHYIGRYSNVATAGSASSRGLLSGESVTSSQNQWSFVLISTVVDINDVEVRVQDVRQLTARADPIGDSSTSSPVR